MKPQQQCCSFGQAKRLKELGVTQLSCFGYSDTGKFFAPYYDDMPKAWTNYFAAFSCAELGVMLPIEMSGYFDGFRLSNDIDSADRTFFTTKYESVPANRANEKSLVINSEQGLSHCMAKMLIILIESNRITAAEVNQRLQSA